MTSTSNALSKLPGPWTRRDCHVAHLNIHVKWSKRLADYAMNSRLAERWESQFTFTSVTERTYQLQERKKGLRVQLSDGAAVFAIDTDPAYDQALVALLELFGELENAKPERLRVELIAEFLQPATVEFEAAVTKVNTQLLNNVFPGRIGCALLDVAYLADLMYGNTRVQLNAGAVRGNEVSRRVHAIVLGAIPPVAYFYSLTAKPAQDTVVSARNTVAVVEEILTLGSHIAQELRS